MFHTFQFPSVINLNVGGCLFATRLSTLTKYSDSMLAVMFSGRHDLDKDCNGNFFIDRDGTYFNHILNFLRHEELPPAEHAEKVLHDAVYYGIDSLVEILKNSPALFTEYVVRENIRKKLVEYEILKHDIISMAREQAIQNSALVSKVWLVSTKNQPIPTDLRLSKQVFKQFFKRFKTYATFESCYGKFCVHFPAEYVDGNPENMMDLIAGCLMHDFKKNGYRGHYKSESVMDSDGKIKTITWGDEEFHVSTSCHEFTFEWIDSDSITCTVSKHVQSNHGGC